MTENGWPPNTNAAPFVSISLDQCVQVTIPGTQETLWFQQGIPAAILPAFMADLNAYVEPVLNSAGYGDEGSWTNGNSVGTSNHLGATAFDYNWEDHPMGNALAGWDGSVLIQGSEEPAVRDLLAFYTHKGIQLVWWGNDWDSPKDSMHFQMGYNTFQNQDICQEFIDQFIRPDGFSTYRRDVPVAPPPPPPAPAPPDAVRVLCDAVPIIDMARAQQLLPAVVAGLAAAQCDNDNRVAMFLAQTGFESDGYATTEEYASGAAYEGRTDLGNTQPGDGVKFKGRTWIQITGRAHYAAFGQWAFDQGLIDNPDQFVNDPSSLADLQWAGIGAAWYWTVERPQINSLCDAGDIVGVTKAVNGGTNGLEDSNGSPGRRTRYNQAIALGDQLLALVTPPTPVAPKGPFMALTDDEQTELLQKTREVWDQLRGPGGNGWPQLGTAADGNGLTPVDAIARLVALVDALKKAS